MEKVKEVLDISKGGGSQGIGVDQSALMDNPEFARQATESEKAQLERERDINPKDLGSYSATPSKEPHHSSALLNKLDPRVGYTPEEAEAVVHRYEGKYGKPREGFLEEKDHLPGSSMSGFGADQSALMQGSKDQVDSEGHV